ncbi:hypothetical protein GS396_00095 [Stenotrophomonas maltophilia]|jgi:hypothetical protein|nr:hypothetical protein [Stenotrophomonas maltophilia]MCI1121141.1 hypothetical protein [Stenotrophomonas maltophilia]QHE19362.1 hypothetical protein GS396_00095 [Stenotrophomonas maltophilia]
MKIIYWLGIAFLWMLPLNFLLLTVAKLLSADPLGSEELVGLGMAVFGGSAGGILYRRRPRKRPGPSSINDPVLGAKTTEALRDSSSGEQRQSGNGP